jgi:hypothetical protein
MSKGSRQRPTADTFRDNWDKIFNKPKREQPMNVLNDVEISSENLRRLYEYFTDPAQGGSTVRYTSKHTGVPRVEVKAFYEVFKVGMMI